MCDDDQVRSTARSLVLPTRPGDVRRSLLWAIWASVTACGPSVVPPGEGATGSDSGPPLASTTVLDDGTSSSGGTVGPGVSTTTNATTSTTGWTEESTSGTSTGEPVGPIAYCAEIYWGGNNDVKIWKRDEIDGVCTLFQLYDGNNDFLDLMIDAPEPFRIDRITLDDDPGGCGGGLGSVLPTDASGAVAFFGGNPISPDVLDADITLGFDPVEPWIPEQVLIQIEGLPINNDCDPIRGPWVSPS